MEIASTSLSTKEPVKLLINPSLPNLHGFFSASIKLPSGYSAGVVVAFYMSNGDLYPKTHDELDFEFLGNVRGRRWRVQTNLYGNGSTRVGREERYDLWFDPTQEVHSYSILWSPERIIFYVDDIPIREVVQSRSMGGDFPSKPMHLYATIWDGSTWATSGGRYKVDYQYAPYVAEFSNIRLHGRPTAAAAIVSDGDNKYSEAAEMSVDRRSAMEDLRQNYMTYSYCHDRRRYPKPPPECPPGSTDTRRRRHRRKSRSRTTAI